MSGERVETRIEVAPAESKPAEPTSSRTGALGSQSGSGAPAPAPAAAPASEENREPESSSATGQAATPGPLTRAVTWFDVTFPHSRHAVIGGVCGLVIALLLFAIGIPKTLVIVVLVVAGVAVGQYLDGDPKLIRLFQSLSKRR